MTERETAELIQRVLENATGPVGDLARVARAQAAEIERLERRVAVLESRGGRRPAGLRKYR